MNNKAMSYYSFPEGAQPKIHINLPFSVWELLASDMRDFSGKDFNGGYSNIVNQIVLSYIENQRYPAYIDDRLIENINVLNKDKEYSLLDKSIKANIESILLSNAKRKIIEEFNVPKEEGKKIDLSKSCREALYNVGLEVNKCKPPITDVFDTIGLYFRAILLHYSRQQYDQRCQIYHHIIYEEIYRIIEKKRSLIVSFDNHENIEIIPYGIVSDIHHIHSYLIGLNVQNRTFKDITLRRLSSIVSVSCGPAHASLTKEEVSHIKEMLITSKVSYLREVVNEYEVYLSKRGEKKYKEIVYQRPVHLPQSEDDKSKHLYKFICSKYQIKNYFRRFGEDAIILSPSKIHDEMCKEYENALNAYKNIK